MSETTTSRRFHNDEPTLVDDLGHAPHVAQVAAMIADCEPPYVLGVHGDWGSGKTSFVRKLHLYLTEKDIDGRAAYETVNTLWSDNKRNFGQFEAVWFEAWRYQHETAPIVALLQEIRAHFGWGHKVMEAAAEASFAAAMSLEELTKIAGFQPSKIVEARDTWQARSGAQPLPSQLYRRLLDQAIRTLLGENKTLLVFIDDLDRCHGEMAFRLLEALKIYLSIPSCVFILGLDVRNVRRAVAAELLKSGLIPESNDKDLARTQAELQSKDYLSKLFQLVYPLPHLGAALPYLSRLLGQLDAPEQAAWASYLQQRAFLPPNPRKIKAFVNALSLSLRDIQPRLKEGTVNRDLVAVATYLRLFEDRLYRLVVADADFFNLLLSFSDGSGGGHEAFTGLKPFFFPARDEEELKKRLKDASVDRFFPDPAEEGLFRIAPLIAQFGRGLTQQEHTLYFRLGS